MRGYQVLRKRGNKELFFNGYIWGVFLGNKKVLVKDSDDECTTSWRC